MAGGKEGSDIITTMGHLRGAKTSKTKPGSAMVFRSHEDAMKLRAGAFRENKSERLKRLRRMTMAQAIREMEALLSIPWPARKRADPPVPAKRFLTV